MTDPAAVMQSGWGLSGQVASLGEGRINDTFLVTRGVRRWVLQRINSRVFADPQALMENVERVVTHITARAPGFVPELVMTSSGRSCHEHAGEYWRVTQFRSNARTLQSIRSVEQARAAGAAFARYQNLLADLPGPPLREPIAGFLRLGTYLNEFAGLAAAGEAWRGFISARAWLQNELQQVDDYIHGDCKVNNLLFVDGADAVACVLDLDTTMRGHWAWDFGDLVRSGAIHEGAFSVELFAALADGFVREIRRPISAAELAIAPRYVCFMLGVRFLTDHLQGDRYFKVAAAGENLLRAQRQFRLLEDMETAEREILQRLRAYD